jgi:hypothetical protein
MTTTHCTVRHPLAEIETIYRSYQVLLLNLLGLSQTRGPFYSQLAYGETGTSAPVGIQGFTDGPYGRIRR